MEVEVCRVWWPRRLRDQQCGVLLGWINLHRRCADLIVAAAIPTLDLEGFLARRGLAAVRDCCGEVVVLGCCVADEILVEIDVEGRRRKSKVWMTCSCVNGFAVPPVCSISLQGRSFSPKVHLILYDRPRFGSHHFSLDPWNFFPSFSRLQNFVAVDNSVTKPYWILELEQQDRGPDIVLVTQQLNCAAFIESELEKRHNGGIISILIAGVAAAVFSLYYAASRVWFKGSNLSIPLLGTALRSSSTVQSINSRFLELSAWPSIYFWCSGRPQHPNAAISHRHTMARNFLWFKIILDLMLGIILGIIVLTFQNSIALFIVTLSCFLTNDVLRTGCIWLMGVPAGFKLNNELAEVMGTAALKITQAFVTILEMLPASARMIQCLGAVSIFFGASVWSSILVDALFVTTVHITMLQRVTAFVYGNQLKILAALWRMFRGRKLNPLRNRIDSYEYSVEELVVASLMFTPLLLLLPTTSVFYTFFTILYASLSIPRLILQITVEILKSFPYIELSQWIVARKRLPSGLVFHLESVSDDLVVSRLNSRLATFDEIIVPYLVRLFSRFNFAAASGIAFNLASGGRLPVNFRSGFRSQPIHSSDLSLTRFFILSFKALRPRDD